MGKLKCNDKIDNMAIVDYTYSSLNASYFNAFFLFLATARGPSTNVVLTLNKPNLKYALKKHENKES